MVKFRWHRGSFSASVGTTVEVSSLGDLHALIADVVVCANISDIRISHYGYDSRLAEETYIVSVTGYGVVGMTNGELS